MNVTHILLAIAKALQTKVYSDPRKTAILRCQSDPELDALLTSDPLEAGVHLLPLGTIASDKLKIYLDRWKDHFDKAIGFRPTGWTYVIHFSRTVRNIHFGIVLQHHQEARHYPQSTRSSHALNPSLSATPTSARRRTQHPRCSSTACLTPSTARSSNSHALRCHWTGGG